MWGFLRNLGTEVLRDHDQDSNDLEKALSYLQHHRLKDISTQSTLLIIGGFGGRFDHELANIHALYRWEAVFHRLVMLDAQGYTELLEANHTIHRIIPVRNTLWTEGYACGLLPMGHQVEEVTTTGLMWNLDKEPLAFGHRISSSNIIPDDTTEVTVQVSQSIIWTCSFRNTDITRA